MKKTCAFLIALCLLLSICPPVCSAQALDTDREVEYLSDGSYIVTEISVQIARASGVKTGTSTKSYYSSDGDLEWKIVLTATFTYDGITAKCTNTNCTTTIYQDQWYKISSIDTYASAMAMAYVKLGRKVLGITVEEVTYNLNLSCSPDGNIY